jgi:molybdate transport system permease protein
MPLAKNGFIASSVMTWARAVGEYGASVTLAGAMAMKTETLPIAISLSLGNAELEKAIAIILILIIIAIFSLLVIRKTIEAVTPDDRDNGALGTGGDIFP